MKCLQSTIYKSLPSLSEGAWGVVPGALQEFDRRGVKLFKCVVAVMAEFVWNVHG
jgi:hypothetical protein